MKISFSRTTSFRIVPILENLRDELEQSTFDIRRFLYPKNRIEVSFNK